MRFPRCRIVQEKFKKISLQVSRHPFQLNVKQRNATIWPYVCVTVDSRGRSLTCFRPSVNASRTLYQPKTHRNHPNRHSLAHQPEILRNDEGEEQGMSDKGSSKSSSKEEKSAPPPPPAPSMVSNTGATAGDRTPPTPPSPLVHQFQRDRSDVYRGPRIEGNGNGE